MVEEALQLAAELSDKANDKISVYQLVKMAGLLAELRDIGQDSEVLIVWTQCRRNPALEQTLRPFVSDVVEDSIRVVHNLDRIALPPAVPQKAIVQKATA